MEKNDIISIHCKENVWDCPVDMNADGSCDVYIGPKKPGKAKNWIQTIHGKGFNILWRIYGPTQVWYDKGWRPSEIELVK